METPIKAVAFGLLEKFPDAGSLTLAKMALKQYPLLFTSVESARKVFRRLRGAHGEKNRKDCVDKTHYREPQKPGDPFGEIPVGKTHFEDWEALQIDGPARVLVLSDVHIPYHDKSAFVAALRYGKSAGVDTVLFNGDLGDFFTVSFWEKDPRQRDLANEIDVQRECLRVIRNGFPKARIIFKEGNHEERWERYLKVKAPELLGMKEFQIPAVLQFSNVGIEDYVGEKRPIRLGLLNVLHGHEYRFAISNPVNAARGLYLRAKAHALCGHFHQRSEHSEKSVEQSKIATWSTGCLCEMHPEYGPLNNWSHGFAIVDVDKEGKFNVQNRMISGGKIF